MATCVVRVPGLLRRILFSRAITAGKSTYLTQKSEWIADTTLCYFITRVWTERKNSLSFQLERTVSISQVRACRRNETKKKKIALSYKTFLLAESIC